jgi:hypothetical protein
MASTHATITTWSYTILGEPMIAYFAGAYAVE